MKNYNIIIEELDTKISNVQTEIDQVNTSALKVQKANIKKLYDSYKKNIEDMQTKSFATLNGTDVLVWDDRFSKFWKTPNVLSIDDVRNKIKELNPSKDNEHYQNLIANSGSFISYMDFENYYLKGNDGNSFTLSLYAWDKLKYIEYFNNRYDTTYVESCGLINAISNDIYADIKASQHRITFKLSHSDISKGDEEVNYQYYIYSFILSGLKEYNYSDDYNNNVIDFEHKIDDLNMFSRQLSVYSSFVNTMLDIHNDSGNLDVSYFPETTDLVDNLNELKRQRRVSFRQKIYQDYDDVHIEDLNMLRDSEGQSFYNYREMKRVKTFYTTNNIAVNNVSRVQVLKRLESKVKLRIFIERVFHSQEGILTKFKSGSTTKVYAPMYIDKNVDIRLYIDFMQNYLNHFNTYGLLDCNEDYLKKIEFTRSSLHNHTVTNVDNWKWQFTKSVIDSYDTSKLNLIEW